MADIWLAKEAVREIYRIGDPDLALDGVVVLADTLDDGVYGREIRRLGRTLRRWAPQIAAWHTPRASNGRVAVAKREYIAVGGDRRILMSSMEREYAAIYGRPDLAHETALAGPREHCVAQLFRLSNAGTNTLTLHPLLDHEEQREDLAAIMEALKTES